MSSALKLVYEREVIPSRNWKSRWQVAVKRVLELAVAGGLLLLFSPLCLFLALAIKLTSKGPLFYCCHWVGRNRIPYRGYKFRSMVANADALKPQLQKQNEMSGPVFKITNDPRVTRVGAWMRRHSLDEIPQLFSVLKGEMSLVGPRPPLESEYAKYAEWQKQKLLVNPGITCLWQVSGRNRINDFKKWIELDFEYIEKWSIWMDVRILRDTVREVLKGTGK